MKNKIIAALVILLGAGVVSLPFYMAFRFQPPVIEHSRHISTDIVDIAIRREGSQRTVHIALHETGQTATLTQTSRRVIRRRTNMPTAPRQQTHHSGDILRIYSVGNVLVVHELQTDQRHYI